MEKSENYESSSPLSGGRIASLDGLRALSIALVLFCHLCGTRSFPVSTYFLRGIADTGNLGVRIFFVISGFLITSLLLEERAITGRISLKNFYLRRVFRIFPAGYTYIAIIGLLGLLGFCQVTRADYLAACTYTLDFVQRHDWNLGHLWSLAVEEQFYLLWPFALCVAGKKHGLLVAGIFFLIGPLSRLAGHLAPDSLAFSSFSFFCNADALASGCLLAGLWGRLGRSVRYGRFRQSWAFLAIPLLAVICVVWEERWPGGSLADLLLNVCIALGIEWCVRRRTTIIGRVLNWRPIAFVGTLSYSLYLWQQLFIDRHLFDAVHSFPLNVMLAFALAALSFFCIERPFLRLRKRFSSVPSPVCDRPVASDPTS